VVTQLPRHGTIRRYKAGCRCAQCSAKNTAEKSKEREAKRRREGKPPRRVPAARKAVPTSANAPHGEDDHGPIETAARAALGSSDADAITELRRQVAFAAARIMDDRFKPHLFSAQSNVLRLTILDLVGAKPPEDGEADVLRNFLGSLSGSRGRRNTAPVHDATKSGP
jgi:hypothetical protein